MRETTALGAAIAAGLSGGLWRNLAELRDINRAGGTVFEPEISRDESTSKFEIWEKAVQMSRGWAGSDRTEDVKTSNISDATVKTDEVACSIAIGDSASSLVSHTFKSPATTDATKRVTRVSVKEIGVERVTQPLVNMVGDLDAMDEEELGFELRKVEILQRLKKFRKLAYY